MTFLINIFFMMKTLTNFSGCHIYFLLTIDIIISFKTLQIKGNIKKFKERFRKQEERENERE